MPTAKQSKAPARTRPAGARQSIKAGRSNTSTLTRAQKRVLDKAAEFIERAKESKQPRFDKKNPAEFFGSIYRWVTEDALAPLPPYSSQSRRRDLALRQFAMREPHWAGVVNSAVSIDKNRGWSLIGGRNQVSRYTSVLHNFRAAADLVGWRPGISSASLAYHTADIGSVVELGRFGRYGPVRGLYNADPALCQLTGKMDRPLRYYPPRRAAMQWEPSDYFRCTSLPSTDEMFNGLGFCSTSRAFELARTLLAVLIHDQEELAARAPKGILLLKGLKQDAWNNALKNREEQMDEKERELFGSLMVLAGLADDVDAKLIALSNLPVGFDLEKFMNLTMYGFALIIGYDPREFWPVSSGTLGTATESEVQHDKATGKGGLEFCLTFQEQLTRGDVLPWTLHYEFDQRDTKGEMQDAELAMAKLAPIVKMATTLVQTGAEPPQDSEPSEPLDDEDRPVIPPVTSTRPLVDWYEARELLVRNNLIPEEWTPGDEDVESTDTSRPGTSTARGRLRRDQLLSQPRILRAVETFPNEPIVKYRYPLNRMQTLFADGKSALHPFWHGIKRAEPLGQWNDTAINPEDIEAAIKSMSKRVNPATGKMIGRETTPTLPAPAEA